MFIDIFDTIKKHTIHGIITISPLAIYTYLSNNAVDDGSYRFLLGVFSYVVVYACSYGLFSCLLHFLDQLLYLSDEERHTFILFKKGLPIVILTVISLLVYDNSDFSAINSVQKLKEITIGWIIMCIIVYILSMMIAYFLNRWFLQKTIFIIKVTKMKALPPYL